MAELSGTVSPAQPGLPRGRASLPEAERGDVHLRRLRRAVIDAVAERGFAACTIADIVERARVSRTVLYRHFDGKLDCFLSAIDVGRDALQGKLERALDTADPASLTDAVEVVVTAYLDTCASEVAHTRAWVLELPAAGDAGIDARNSLLDRLADLFHRLDQEWNPGVVRPDAFYTALVGGVNEVVSRDVRAGRTAHLLDRRLDLQDTIVGMLR